MNWCYGLFIGIQHNYIKITSSQKMEQHFRNYNFLIS